MNILYIAYFCSPYWGSEDRIGWRIPLESAKSNCVYVITRIEERRSIEQYTLRHSLENIWFYYVDIHDIYKKIFKGTLYPGRLNIWHCQALPLARKLCIEKNIDIIHQITPVEFRSIGNYEKISGVKFVCGPLGGGEYIPSGLGDYVKNHIKAEMFRCFINRWYCLNLRLSGKLEKSDCYFMFANWETYEFLNGKDITRNSHHINCEITTEIAVDSENIRVENKYPQNEKCMFLTAGRIIYRKGYEYLLDALEHIPEEYDYQCKIVGNGPELERLKTKCDESEKLSKHIIFMGTIPYTEMSKEYDSADAFVMPSLRETTGSVLLEAMSRGVPVITIRKFGGVQLLDDDSAWLYDGNSKAGYNIWEEKNRHYQEIYMTMLDICEKE